MPTILGHEVGPIGYGLMSLTLGAPDKLPSQEQAFETLRTAADQGCLVWAGADFYGPPSYNSLVLLNHFFAAYPEYADKVVLSVKGSMRPNWVPDGSPEFIRSSVENSINQLGGKGRVHMFASARRDLKVPWETQLNTLKDLVQEGKIDSVALSEVNATTIREAAKLVKVSAVEIELSIWNTSPLSNGIVQTCAELNIPILAYSPLGRAMLTGELKSPDDIPEGDMRRATPMYQPGNFEENLKLVEEITKLADEKGCTTGQVALGWLVTLSKQAGMPVIIPIPGTKSIDHLRENAAAVELTDEDFARVDLIISNHTVVGTRYPAFAMHMTDL